MEHQKVDARACPPATIEYIRDMVYKEAGLSADEIARRSTAKGHPISNSTVTNLFSDGRIERCCRTREEWELVVLHWGKRLLRNKRMPKKTDPATELPAQPATLCAYPFPVDGTSLCTRRSIETEYGGAEEVPADVQKRLGKRVRYCRTHSVTASI